MMRVGYMVRLKDGTVGRVIHRQTRCYEDDYYEIQTTPSRFIREEEVKSIISKNN